MKPFTLICPFLIALHFPRWPIFHNICSLLSELEALLFLPLPPPSLLLLLSLIALIHPPLLMPVIFLSSFHAPTSSYNRFNSSSSSFSLFTLTLLSHPVLSLSASTLLHFLSSPLSLTHSCRRKPLILYTHFLPVLRLPHCCSSIIPPPSNLVLLSSSSSSFISLHHIPAFHILPLSSPPLPLLPSSLLCF